jgi:hypothetical protein
MQILDLIYAGIVAGVFGIAGWLLKRVFEGNEKNFEVLNKKLDEQSSMQKSTWDQLSSIKLEVNGYKMLAEYMQERIVVLEHKCETLEKSHMAIDKHIAVMQAQGRILKNPN